jgi:hypothetical protein
MNGQSYNRYSYVLNNPTNLTDPTGFAAKSCVTTTGSNIPTCAGDDDVVVNFKDGGKELLRGNGKGQTVEKLVAQKLNEAGVEKIDPKLSTTQMAAQFNEVASNLPKYGQGAQTQILSILNGYANTLFAFPNTAGSLESQMADSGARTAAAWAREQGLVERGTPFSDAEARMGGTIGAAFQIAGRAPRSAKGESSVEPVSETALATGGRLGNQATRNHVDQVATEMEKRGWQISNGGGRAPEEYLAGPGGARLGSSYPDITATKNGKTLRVNTIDTLANGVTPTKREADNATRIRAQTGEHVLLVPKP